MSLGGISTFDYAVISCIEMEATRAFYRDVMRFPIEIDRPNWVSFRVGATLLTLRPRDDEQVASRAAPIQLAFRVALPAVDACYAELVALSIPILRGPVDLLDWRHRALFFRDPEENIIEIYAEY